MKPNQPVPKQPDIKQGKAVEKVLRRAARQALLTHQRAGNSVAAWREGCVVLIPAGEINVETGRD